jgi:DNA-directed RNA polymerase subunit M
MYFISYFITSIEFCPYCETRLETDLNNQNNSVKCTNCGSTIQMRKQDSISDNATPNLSLENSSISSDQEIRLLDDTNKKQNTSNPLPTIDVACPKCKNGKAFWWIAQTRSADDPSTQFFRCTNCNNTWRNYD